jgi:hypothetical protein
VKAGAGVKNSLEQFRGDFGIDLDARLNEFPQRHPSFDNHNRPGAGSGKLGRGGNYLLDSFG